MLRIQGMLNIITVTFFGHRNIIDSVNVEKQLEVLIRELIDKNEYVVFLIGRNGEFDQCVASAVIRVQKQYRDDNSSLDLVLPYPTAEYLNNQQYFEDYYDNIEISYEASKSHPKSAIWIRNREMIDRSDMVVCYVRQCRGGAYKARRYAIQHGKQIIDLF